MWQESTSHLTCWTKQSGGGKKNGKERKGKMGKKEEEVGERSSTFFLDFSTIGPSVQVGARDKVGPHIESYVWVAKLVIFAKLREVGFFSYSV